MGALRALRALWALGPVRKADASAAEVWVLMDALSSPWLLAALA